MLFLEYRPWKTSMNSSVGTMHLIEMLSRHTSTHFECTNHLPPLCQGIAFSPRTWNNLTLALTQPIGHATHVTLITGNQKSRISKLSCPAGRKENIF